jgi:hypothetical protein
MARLGSENLRTLTGTKDGFGGMHHCFVVGTTAELVSEFGDVPNHV